MSKIPDKREDDWQAAATAAAITGARKIANNCPSLPAMTPVGRLSDAQWGWVLTGAIFAWVEKRVEQAIAEGLDQEQAVRDTGLTPSPGDVAVVASILAELAEKAAIDWSLPLASWSKDTMVNFLLLAWQLINKAELARDHGSGSTILRKPTNRKEGDALPFAPGSS
ncbi:MAG: hypothetical protein ACM3SP_19985 [Chloroflexota bacterium]